MASKIPKVLRDTLSYVSALAIHVSASPDPSGPLALPRSMYAVLAECMSDIIRCIVYSAVMTSGNVCMLHNVQHVLSLDYSPVPNHHPAITLKPRRTVDEMIASLPSRAVKLQKKRKAVADPKVEQLLEALTATVSECPTPFAKLRSVLGVIHLPIDVWHIVWSIKMLKRTNVDIWDKVYDIWFSSVDDDDDDGYQVIPPEDEWDPCQFDICTYMDDDDDDDDDGSFLDYDFSELEVEAMTEFGATITGTKTFDSFRNIDPTMDAKLDRLERDFLGDIASPTSRVRLLFERLVVEIAQHTQRDPMITRTAMDAILNHAIWVMRQTLEVATRSGNVEDVQRMFAVARVWTKCMR